MSFMKKVAKVAAPFASLIPGAGPFIGAGLSALGSIGGGGGGGSKKQSPMDAQMMRVLAGQESRSNEMFGMGKPMLSQGQQFLKAPTDLWQNILAGGDKANQALAGPMADIATGYGRAQANTARFAPRGSVASAFADNGRMMAKEMSRLRSDLLMNSADRLAGTGQGLITSGANLMGGSQAGLNSVLQAILGDKNLQVQKDMASNQKWSGLGQGIGSLLGTLLMPGGVLNQGGK